MNTSSYASPLTGLSERQKSELAGISDVALENEADRLSIQAKRLQLQAFGVGDQASLDRDTERLANNDAALKQLLADSPALAKPVADIVELARRARENDPAAADVLRETRADLKAVGSRAEEEHVEDQRERISDDSRWSTKSVPQLANEVEGEGPGAALASRFNPKAVPDEVVAKYKIRGNEFIHPRDPNKIAFVDHGSRLQTNKSFDGEAIKSMVAIAEARGWDSIKVTGDAAFRRAIWFEAATHGINVQGYQPTDADKAAAVSAAERGGRLNRVEENASVRAFLDAKDSNERSGAAKAHPELKNAFALETALKKFAASALPPKDRDAFMERQRRNIATDLAQGNQLPTVSVRPQRQQQRQLDREAETER